MSIYEHEKRARAQGFYFAVVLRLPTWEQFGHVMWSTPDAAFEDACRSIEQQRAHGADVRRVSLRSPFTSEAVSP
jgi:hypothetical protein